MSHIVILIASIRNGRNSLRAGRYFQQYLAEQGTFTHEILDLKDYNFPLFEERLKFLAEPGAEVLDFAARIRAADGVIMVVPEYNGGYPASLKNVIDLLYEEWYKKPIGIATVSDGVFGGNQVITALQFVLWKMKAWTIPAMFPIPQVIKNFDESGTPFDKEGTDKRAAGFIRELAWCIEANRRMKEA